MLIEEERSECITTDSNAEEIINRYARKSDHWLELLERENRKLAQLLARIVNSIPRHGPIKSENKDLDIIITCLYMKEENLVSAINKLTGDNNSRSITARFILLRSAYEGMCAMYYAAEFPEKAAL